jgi:phosphoribosylamine--glycine ligase
VVKADGLAAGKGVVVAATEAMALAAITQMMEARTFGAAGAAVVIEECLSGEEVSFFALCDGEHAIPLGTAQDYKRVGEGDTGPNTGGMGAVSPVPIMARGLEAALMDRVIRPALVEMKRRSAPFRGVLFAGLMLTDDGPKLIEFNVRFGDPECQALLPRLKSDLLLALLAAYDGELGQFDLRWNEIASVAVVMAAQGYPEAPRRGTEIQGLDRAAKVPGVLVFHAGTEKDSAGRFIAAGGRVLTICGKGADLRAAQQAAYEAIGLVQWSGGFYRKDIGARLVGRG